MCENRCPEAGERVRCLQERAHGVRRRLGVQLGLFPSRRLECSSLQTAENRWVHVRRGASLVSARGEAVENQHPVGRGRGDVSDSSVAAQRELCVPLCLDVIEDGFCPCESSIGRDALLQRQHEHSFVLRALVDERCRSPVPCTSVRKSARAHESREQPSIDTQHIH